MKPHFIFFTPVWGAHHREIFVKYGVPSLMAAGNIPYMVNNDVCTQEFFIYTHDEDVAYLESAPSIIRMRELMPVSIRVIPADRRLTWAEIVGSCYIDLLQHTPIESPYIIHIWPDCAWSSQFCFVMLDAVLQGYDIVVETGLRSNRPGVEPYLQAQLVDGVLELHPSEVVRLGMENLHNHYLQTIWRQELFTTWPSVILFPVGTDGAIMRTFHANIPVMKADRNILPTITSEETLDGGIMVGRLIEKGARVYYVLDSDECVHVELSPSNYSPHPILPHGLDTIDIALWAQRNVRAHHLAIFEKTFYLHAGSLGPQWREMHKQSNEVFGRVIEWLQIFDQVPRTLHQLGLHSRHKMIEGAYLVKNNRDWAGFDVERSIGFLLSGRASEAAACLGDPIAKTIAGKIYEGPDPLEWSWYIIALICQGYLEEARSMVLSFPRLIHPEVDRTRWLVNALYFKQITAFESDIPVDKIVPSWNRRIPLEFVDWLSMVVSILRANKRNEYANLLMQYDMLSAEAGVAS